MRRILFVDDDSRVLEGLQRMLRPQRNQWEMSFAQGGDAALAILETMPFDVIVSDMRMPVMDGATLLAKVRERYPHMVRIVLSGHTELETALRAVPVAHQFLAKPCDQATLRVAVERACHLKALLSDESICRTVGAMGELPSVPRVYEALTRALGDPDAALGDIAKIVEQDVAISAKILQIVNSAFFGLAQPMTNIKSAVSYLGVNTLKNLVLAVEVFRAFKPNGLLKGFSLDALQDHAQLTANIVGRLPVPKHLAEVAVVSGMFHDVGKLILACKLPERFATLLGAARTARRPLHEIETEQGGATHAEIGAYLLGLWGLPYAIVETVANHHCPTRLPQQGFDAVASVYVANCLAHEQEARLGVRTENEGPSIDVEYLRNIDVADQLPDWREMAAECAISTERTGNRSPV
jgi:HD-like signal output (HDOD) protein/CheY-like chemotaxis protein